MSECPPDVSGLEYRDDIIALGGLQRNIKVCKQKIIHGKEKFEEEKEGKAFSA